MAGSAFQEFNADTPIDSLSGGERARLLLAIATLDRPNLLILDEPTNHLDIDGREELLNALNDYDGAVLLISHDRRVIESCADRLLLVADGRVQPFDGDMDDYRNLILAGANSAEETSSTDRPQSRAEQRKHAAGRRLALKPLKDEVDRWEREVARLHSEVERLDAALAAPGLFAKNPDRATALSKARAEAGRRLSEAEAGWLDAAGKYEAAIEG